MATFCLILPIYLRCATSETDTVSLNDLYNFERSNNWLQLFIVH